MPYYKLLDEIELKSPHAHYLILRAIWLNTMRIDPKNQAMVLFRYDIDNINEVQEHPEDNIVHLYYEMQRHIEHFHHDWSIHRSIN